MRRVWRKFMRPNCPVSGGGPGGLALASVIGKYSDPAAPIAIDLYESQEQIGTVGAGISASPRTCALLETLGLMDGLKGELSAADKNEGPTGASDYAITICVAG
jgi:salicylate hydroxylase